MAGLTIDIDVIHQTLLRQYPLEEGGFIVMSALRRNEQMINQAFPATISGADEATQWLRAIDTRMSPLGLYARVTRVGTMPGEGQRGSNDDSLDLPALAGDLDFGDIGHKHFCPVPCPDTHPHKCRQGCTEDHKHRLLKPLAADEDQARQIITAAGLPEPTEWQHSGGGLYPIWRLDPIPDITSDNRDQVASVVKKWQAIIKDGADKLGLYYGTANSDLSRVLRIPGSVNRKEGNERPARVLSADGPTYTLKQAEQLVDQLAPKPQTKPAPPPFSPPAAQQRQQSKPFSQPSSGGLDDIYETTPLDDFNARFGGPAMVDYLTTRGYTYDSQGVWQSETVSYMARPGKGAGKSISVTQARGSVYCFTDADSVFEDGQSYSPAMAWALQQGHPGLTKEAIRELERQGYGRRRPRTPFVAPAEAGQEEELRGGTLPSPNEPMAVARDLVRRMTRRTTWWRSDFYQHVGTHYEPIDSAVMQRWLYLQTENAVYEYTTEKGEEKTKNWAPNKNKIANLTDAIGIGVLQHVGEEDKVMAFTNGVLDPFARELSPHTPDRFNLYCLTFAYNPDAECPAFLEFLESILPGDQQAKDFIQEWFGYVLSGRTDMQKIGCFIGKKRSGKGTLFRLLTDMLGSENVAGINLPSLGARFGTEGLVGKALAVDADVRWHSKGISDAVPILLKISGEDKVPVERKHQKEWNGRLSTRIMLLSNDTPSFSDRSGALNGRLVYVHLAQSFFGREDITLIDKLRYELPGILNWALDGLDRLYARGAFTEPESGQIERETAQRISDPITSFIEDCIEPAPGQEVNLDVVFRRFRDWSESEGRTKDSTTKAILSRDLRQKIDGLVIKRVRLNGVQTQMCYGIDCPMPSLGGGYYR